MNKSDQNREIIKNIGLITQIGLNTVVLVFMGLWLGVKLDKFFNKNYFFTIFFMLLASITAIYNIYRLSYIKKEKDGDE